MTTRKGPDNQPTIPVLDRHGQPLAPARPSRVRRWPESGRANKVWIKGIFAVQLNDLDAAHASTGKFALNMDPGETAGIAITRESPDGKCHAIVGAYEHQHRNREIHRNLNSRRDCRRNRRSRLDAIPERTRIKVMLRAVRDDHAEIMATLTMRHQPDGPVLNDQQAAATLKAAQAEGADTHTLRDMALRLGIDPFQMTAIGIPPPSQINWAQTRSFLEDLYSVQPDSRQ